MFTCGRKEPPPSAHLFNSYWDIAVVAGLGYCRRCGVGASLWTCYTRIANEGGTP